MLYNDNFSSLATRTLCNVFLYSIATKWSPEFEGYQGQTFPGEPERRLYYPVPRRFIEPSIISSKPRCEKFVYLINESISTKVKTRKILVREAKQRS